MGLREQIEAESLAAKRAVALLEDDAVSRALAQAAELVRDRRDTILAANQEDVDAAGGLDEGTLDRLVILRGSGETTAALARLAAESGVRTLAHAEGGGVLYVHADAAKDKALAIVAASLDRLGVCNRLNLCLVDRRANGLVPDLLELFASRGIEVRGELGREWANDPDPSQVTVCYLDSLDEAVRIANEETS